MAPHGEDCSVLYRYIVSVFVVISGQTNICKNPHIGHRYDIYWYISTPPVESSVRLNVIQLRVQVG